MHAGAVALLVQALKDSAVAGGMKTADAAFATLSHVLCINFSTAASPPAAKETIDVLHMQALPLLCAMTSPTDDDPEWVMTSLLSVRLLGGFLLVVDSNV